MKLWIAISLAFLPGIILRLVIFTTLVHETEEIKGDLS